MAHRIGISLMALGVIAVLASAGLLSYNVWDDNRAAEASLETAQALLAQISVAPQPAPVAAPPAFLAEAANPPEPTPTPEMHSIEIDGEKYIGVLSIPSLSLELPVCTEWSYSKLKKSPCRYLGDVYADTLVIAAHNYKKHFGGVSELAEGEAVVMLDADGYVHRYRVAEIYTARPSDVRQVVYSDYDLTLFTCTYGGRARVVVRCERE